MTATEEPREPTDAELEALLAPVIVVERVRQSAVFEALDMRQEGAVGLAVSWFKDAGATDERDDITEYLETAAQSIETCIVLRNPETQALMLTGAVQIAADFDMVDDDV